MAARCRQEGHNLSTTGSAPRSSPVLGPHLTKHIPSRRRGGRTPSRSFPAPRSGSLLPRRSPRPTPQIPAPNPAVSRLTSTSHRTHGSKPVPVVSPLPRRGTEQLPAAPKKSPPLLLSTCNFERVTQPPTGEKSPRTLRRCRLLEIKKPAKPTLVLITDQKEFRKRENVPLREAASPSLGRPRAPSSARSVPARWRSGGPSILCAPGPVSPPPRAPQRRARPRRPPAPLTAASGPPWPPPMEERGAAVSMQHHRRPPRRSPLPHGVDGRARPPPLPAPPLPPSLPVSPPLPPAGTHRGLPAPLHSASPPTEGRQNARRRPRSRPPPAPSLRRAPAAAGRCRHRPGPALPLSGRLQTPLSHSFFLQE